MKQYSCRFCKNSFSSSQRLQSHLTKKNPCHPSLKKNTPVEDEPKPEESNIVETKEDFPISSNPFLDMISSINAFVVRDRTDDLQANLMCRYCNKVFKNKYNLSYHLQVCEKKHTHDSDMTTSIKNHDIQCKVVINGLSKLLEEKELQIKELQKQIQDDNKSKTQIIAQQNVIQEKTIDALAYLQANHKHTPKFEFPEGFLLTDDEMKRYINMNNTSALVEILRRMFWEDRPIEQIPLWCLDISREKFAIKDDHAWQIDYGGNKLINAVLNPVHDQFLRYVSKISKDYMNTDKVYDFIDIQNKIIEMWEDKTKREVVRKACNEFHIKKVFNTEEK